MTKKLLTCVLILPFALRAQEPDSSRISIHQLESLRHQAEAAVDGPRLSLPPRPADAPAGSAVIRQLTPLTLEEREQAIFGHVMAGNIPDFQRTLVPVTSTALVGQSQRSLTYFVLADYLALGSNDDHFYTPMTPVLAQKLADALHCTLPTRRMVDTIYSRAAVKLRPQPIPPSAEMITVPVFAQHNDSVRQQRALYIPTQPLGALVGGNKKDLIISNLITQNLKTGVPNPVVIYGWHQLNGVPIQPAYNGHGNTYADYSHGTRLVLDSMILDGAPTHFTALVVDPILNALVSDEGAIAQPRYLSALPVPPPRSFGLVPLDGTTLRVLINAVPGMDYFAFPSRSSTSFSDSVLLNTSNFLLTGLTTDSLYYVRLKAYVDAEGSSFSELLAATPTLQPVGVLVVHGFDRAVTGNAKDFVKYHAEAFSACGERVASCTNGAVIEGFVSLETYDIVSYVLGSESTVDETFSSTEQDLVKTFLRNGRALFVSGSEIAWDLDYKGSASDKAFFNEFLKAQYLNDAPGGLANSYYRVEPTISLFSSIGVFSFDNGTYGTINVSYPDVIGPMNGSTSCMQYFGVSSSPAGVLYVGGFPGGHQEGNLVYFGFPFESIYPGSVRIAIIQGILSFFRFPNGVMGETPTEFGLEQNYPNPFNPTTNFGLQIAEYGFVKISVFDLLGREVAVLVNEEKSPGSYTVTWDAGGYSSGVYFYTMHIRSPSGASLFHSTRSMLLMK